MTWVILPEYMRGVRLERINEAVLDFAVFSLAQTKRPGEPWTWEILNNMEIYPMTDWVSAPHEMRGRVKYDGFIDLDADFAASDLGGLLGMLNDVFNVVYWGAASMLERYGGEVGVLPEGALVI